MGWEVDQDSMNPPPAKVMAVYYLVLSSENVVMNSTDLTSSWAPSEYVGTLDQYMSTLISGTPLIPVDTHHALEMGWVDMARMSRNRPYLDEAIRAAIALVA